MSQQEEAPKRPYRYYSTHRPIGPGTIPPPRLYKPLEVINYDEPLPVEDGAMIAWGEVHYSQPLPERAASDYELEPAPDNPPAPHQHRAHEKSGKSHDSR